MLKFQNKIMLLKIFRAEIGAAAIYSKDEKCVCVCLHAYFCVCMSV